MKRLLLILTILSSCNQEDLSEIEIIKFDNSLEDNLRNTNDTMFVQKLEWRDPLFFQVEKYVSHKYGDTTEVYKDSSGTVVALTKSKNGKNLFSAEYFPNGQLKGKLPKDKHGIENGSGRYYYENGRVQREGFWKNGTLNGKWKNYDKDGRLVSISEY